MPPTIAESHSPIRMELKAQSSAYIDELQAVSIMNDGPRKPNANDTRFANIARLELLNGVENLFCELEKFGRSNLTPLTLNRP